MNDTTQNRFEIDLDEIERQLRRSAEAGAAAPAAGNLDPLAELARIVGQEDPFGSILGDAKPRAAHAETPSAAVLPPSAHDETLPAAVPPPFDIRLTAEDRGVLGSSPPVRPEAAPAPSSRSFDPAGDVYGDRDRAIDEEEFAPLAPRRSRRRLALAFAAIGVAAVGVAGALTWRQTGGRFAASGPPPLVKADNAPVKVAPENPGGIEIPDQNRQIYDKGADNGRSRVLDRQEQPIDVREAARSLPPSEPPPPAVVNPSPVPRGTVSTADTGAGSTPPPAATPSPPRVQQNAVLSALGEPRRVRTVAVRPDGSAIGSPAGAGAPDPTGGIIPGGQLPPPIAVSTVSIPAGPAPAASAATPAGPSSSPGTTPAVSGTAVTVLPPQRPRPASSEIAAADPVTGTAALRAAPSDTPSAAAPPPSPEAQAAAVSILPPPRPNRRVAAVAAPPPATDDAAAPAPAGTETQPSGRSFAVQLAVRPSEDAARTAYNELADKYATDLGGKPATVTRAEVKGKTVYRVRVAPLSREDANTLCTRLKSSGGQCFVSAN